jgi:hypothetical protein
LLALSPQKKKKKKKKKKAAGLRAGFVWKDEISAAWPVPCFDLCFYFSTHRKAKVRGFLGVLFMGKLGFELFC